MHVNEGIFWDARCLSDPGVGEPSGRTVVEGEEECWGCFGCLVAPSAGIDCCLCGCRNRVEVAYREAVALKRQEELIREEEAAGLAETELRAKREAAEKEKRSKKKQVRCFALML